MELTPQPDFSEDLNQDASRAKTSLRIQYDAQVRVIRSQIGDLEAVRTQLGLSQRKMAQLLMVDPSSWTRWTKQGDEAPPMVWRSLQWYMAVREKIPGLTPQYFIGNSPQVLHEKTLQILETEKNRNLSSLREVSEKVEKTLESNKSLEMQVLMLEKDVKFYKNLSFLFSGLLSVFVLVGFWIFS